MKCSECGLEVRMGDEICCPICLATVCHDDCDDSEKHYCMAKEVRAIRAVQTIERLVSSLEDAMDELRKCLPDDSRALGLEWQDAILAQIRAFVRALS